MSDEKPKRPTTVPSPSLGKVVKDEECTLFTGELTILKALAKMFQESAEVFERMARHTTPWLEAYWKGAADQSKRDAQQVRDLLSGKPLTQTVARIALRDLMKSVHDTWIAEAE